MLSEAVRTEDGKFELIGISAGRGQDLARCLLTNFRLIRNRFCPNDLEDTMNSFDLGRIKEKTMRLHAGLVAVCLLLLLSIG